MSDRARLVRQSWLLAVCMYAFSPQAWAQASQTPGIPENALSTTYGRGWDCAYGFVERNATCERVEAPPEAYINSLGTGWSCNRGYRKEADRCVGIAVPENANATNNS